MSAFVVVELKVKDSAAKERYSAAAGPIIKKFGGEFLVSGAWEALAGETGLSHGAIIRFPNRVSALSWYQSDAYQSTLTDRSAGMECTFRLIGA
ncbi:DUF1330 domain-containing protein [Ruegeria sp. EL01]|jgi:uncharacterized protein (DUF1330 family)|uniref:DUF1330 domain-containing protein n=1 Tax=Ruegeria sp. EL01 TaxID=2107578 RepID=UPI000EA80533|nr:DUF1330 domain-containing protein [Ruegeria sp. EL01]